MPNEMVPVLRGTVLDEEGSFTLEQICQICRLEKKVILTLVEEGVLDPEGEDPATWKFPGTSVTHVRIVVRLQRDLGVNLQGAAVVLDLLDRLALPGRRGR
ncbi:MAG: chaperone modulator CbpM [Thermoanaerobaculia bacterium]